MAAEIATDVVKDMAGTIIGEVIQQIKDVVQLEENLQVIHTDFARMESFLDHIHTQFQGQHKILPKPAEMCLRRMDTALTEVKQLIDRIKQQRSRCFGCCILCNRKLFKECRDWKTTFDLLFQELRGDLQILADTEQIVSKAADKEEAPVLLQPVPDSGFVGLGIQSAETRLQKWLTEFPHRVVGVYGMGGVGKTSLLQLIHNHFKKVSGIFDVIIWVTVSLNFKIEGLQNSIAKTLDLKFDESFDNDRRKMELSASLENKRFLLILDNMWDRIDYDEVGIRFGNDKGSKVLISTRSAEVIAEMGANECSLKIQPLSEDEAWELFKRKAFTDGSALDKNIEVIARQISKECKGLPLAVNVVGAVMTCKKTEEEWNRALTLMRNTDPNFRNIHRNIDAKLYQPLRYSYNDLRDDKLKICFLYCAAFPEDAEIDAETLVEIWIAEGLVTGRGTTNLMDVGLDYLDLLVNRCLIDYVVQGDYLLHYKYNEIGRYKYVKTIKVHDVLRDMAIHIGESEEHWLFATNQQLPKFRAERDQIKECKRIGAVGCNNIDDLPMDLQCPNLVSLVLASNESLKHVAEPFLSNVMPLRVLDLSSTGITGLPISVGELRRIEFLNLSSCRCLIELPESIGNLSELQFLNLTDCLSLKALPNAIRGLKKLKHLTLGGCFGIEVNSRDIGQLSSLNKLVLPIPLRPMKSNKWTMRVQDVIGLPNMRELVAEVESHSKVGTMDIWREMRHLSLRYTCDAVENTLLGNIENMKTLQSFTLMDFNGASLPECVCEFQNLKILYLYFCDKVRELPTCNENASPSFSMLRIMRLTGLMKLESMSGQFNVWNEGSMCKLQKLTISFCSLLMKLPQGMRLPHLKVLDIDNCDQLKELDIGSGGFSMLEELSLETLNSLETITGSSGVWNEEAISKLEKVEIRFCPLLRKLPKTMEKLSKSNKIIWEDENKTIVFSDLFTND